LAEEEADAMSTNDHSAPSVPANEDDTPQNKEAQDVELVPLDSQLVAEEDEGYESDDERPSKRGKMDSVY